jgi:hypothetical protein
MDKIYDMNLHVEIDLNDNGKILRVPGGWIYQFYNQKLNLCDEWEWCLVNSVFVPLYNEFQSEVKR